MQSLQMLLFGSKSSEKYIRGDSKSFFIIFIPNSLMPVACFLFCQTSFLIRVYKRASLILDRDEGGQTCSWRSWGYDWEKEGSCGHVHQLQWDPDGFCILPSCRLVFNFRFMLSTSVSVTCFSKTPTNTLL